MLTYGMMDGSMDYREGNIFVLSFHAFITIGMRVIFLITNRVSKQIILHTKV